MLFQLYTEINLYQENDKSRINARIDKIPVKEYVKVQNEGTLKIQGENKMKNIIGIIQSRLTSSPDGKLQFFPSEWEKEFPLAKKIGFEAIEWVFYSQKNPIFSKNGVGKILQLAKKNKIIVLSICGDYFIDMGFIGETAEESAKILKRLIWQGARIGIKRILIPLLEKSEIKNEAEKKEVIKNLKPCVETAELFNIELALETSLPAEELKKFISRFKSPMVKVYYDTGNCTTYFGPKVPDEIRALGNLITGVHVKDRKFGSEKSEPLGQGDANFPEIFRAFKEINYRGPFMIQAARNPVIDDITLCAKYLEFVKKHIEGGEKFEKTENGKNRK